jgi:hypothetical protein
MKLLNLPFAFILGLSLFLLSSCSSILTAAMGVKEPKPLTQDELLKEAKRQDIPQQNIAQLDTLYLAYFKEKKNPENEGSINNHLQPLQACYYDKKGQLVSFHINCYAGGFPNLKWNRDGNFDTFLPKQQAPIDSILPLQAHLNHLQTQGGKTVILNPDMDYYVLIHWNRFMGRQSKRLIREVKQNILLTNKLNIQVFFINSDNFIYHTIGK